MELLKPARGTAVVQRIEAYTYQVEILVPPKSRDGREQVFVNGNAYGLAVKEYEGRSYVYPKSVSYIAVVITDYRFCKAYPDHCVTLRLGTDPIPYSEYAYVGRDATGARIPGRKQLVTRSLYHRTQGFGGTIYTFELGRTLIRGQIIATDVDTPFHIDGKILTNAPTQPTFAIPLRRPEGKDWESYEDIHFLQAITGVNWSTLIQTLDGLFASQSIDNWRFRPASERPHALQKLRQDRPVILYGNKKVDELGECYAGTHATYVALGKYLIFTIPVGQGQALYLVDAPSYGTGLYLFETFPDAEAWAKRDIDMIEARRRALGYLNHSGNWEKVVFSWLNDLGALPNHS